MPSASLFGLTANGLLVAFACALALLAACLFAAKTRAVDWRLLLFVSPFALAFGFAGARSFYVLFNRALYRTWADVFAFTDGGYSLFGGMLGAGLAIVAVLLLRREREFLLPALDAAAFGGALGIAVGRWGNLLNQECFGDFVQSPALRHFPFAVYIDLYDDYCVSLFLPESLLCLCLFLVLLPNRSRDVRPGSRLFWFLTWYCGARVLIESMRQDSMYIGFVRISQVIAALTLIVLFVVLLVRKARFMGFHAIDFGACVAFLAAVGTGFWAEFYMGSESRVGNLLLLAGAAAALSGILTAEYLALQHERCRRFPDPV